MRFEGVSKVEQRLEMVLARERDGLTVREVCLLWSVSPDTFHKWRNRYEAEGLAGLEDRSSQPARSPNRLAWAVESQIVAMREAHPRWGPRRIRAELARRGVVKLPARSTIGRVLERNGLLDPDRRPEPARKSLQRFVRSRPNELWQTDVKDWLLPNGSIAHIYSILDDHSRLCIAIRAFRDQTTENAIALFDEGCTQYGLPHSVLSDRGVIFTGRTTGSVSRFERHLWTRGICTINGAAYHPQTQGKIERYHRTLGEWLADHPARSDTTLAHLLDAFRTDYNNERPHQGIDDHTPVEVWNATSRAVPDPDGTVKRRQRRSIRATSNTGNVTYSDWVIGLGRDWMNTKVELIDDGATITVNGADGTHIRTVTPDNTRRYLPTGRPRGRPRRNT